jgi:hypothetical protein
MDLSDPLQQIERAVELLGTPAGAAGLAMIALLAFACMVWRSAWWACLTIVLFIVTLGRAYRMIWLDTSMIQPWETLMVNSRPLAGSLLIILAVTAALQPRGPTRMTMVLGAGIGFLAMQVAMGLHALLTSSVAYAAVSTVLYVLLFLGITYGISRRITDRRSATAAVAAIFVAGALFAFASMTQYMVRSSAALHGNRFVGVAANANFAALALSTSLLCGLFLLLSRDVRSALKPGIIAFVAVFAVLIAWTGSRNALLMSTIGGLILFRSRLGRGMVIAVVCGALSVAIVQYWLQVESIGERLLSTEDTRSEVWASMLEQFARSPLIGSTSERQFTTGSENSYLLAGSEYGLMVLAPLVIAVGLLLRHLLWLNRRRVLAGDDRTLLDLATGGCCALLAGSLFDGFLLANYSFALLVLLAFIAILAYVTDQVILAETFGHPQDQLNPYHELADAEGWPEPRQVSGV